MADCFAFSSPARLLAGAVFCALLFMVLLTVVRQAWRTRRDAQTPRALAVAARVAPINMEGRRYAISLENRTEFLLVDGSMDMRWILHPGNFSGLDDTHMPDDIWTPQPIRFATLAPGARQTFDVQGYGTAREYDGPQCQAAILLARRAETGKVSAAPEAWQVQVLMTWVS